MRHAAIKLPLDELIPYCMKLLYKHKLFDFLLLKTNNYYMYKCLFGSKGNRETEAAARKASRWFLVLQRIAFSTRASFLLSARTSPIFSACPCLLLPARGTSPNFLLFCSVLPYCNARDDAKLRNSTDDASSRCTRKEGRKQRR